MMPFPSLETVPGEDQGYRHARWDATRCGVVGKVVDVSVCRDQFTPESNNIQRRLASSQMQSKEKVVDVPGVT